MESRMVFSKVKRCFCLFKTFTICLDKNDLLTFPMPLSFKTFVRISIYNRSKFGPLALAFLIQAALLCVAVFVVVLAPEAKPNSAFVVKKKLYLPQKELEHKVALAAFQNATASPMQIGRISTAALIPNSMPALPDLPKSAFNPIERNPIGLQSEALLGQSKLLGALNGAKIKSSSTSLFGIEDQGQRILILFDNSSTVWNKASAAGITNDAFVSELSGLVDRLNANTLFGLVPFARKVGTFRDYMIAATARNKSSAKRWIVENIRSNRKKTQLAFAENGIQGALTVAFQMEPDVIFIISDGDFQRSKTSKVSAGDVPWDDVEKTLRSLIREYGIKPRIHFVGFQVESEDTEAIKKITRRYGGEFKSFGKK